MFEAIQNQRVFITGGAGFIGSTLVACLADKNEIVVFDNMTRDALSASAYAKHSNVRIVVGSVLDPESLGVAMRGSNIVIHCAGIAGIDTVIKSPVNTMHVNMIGSANVLAEAEKLDACKRVVCFSTSEVFGQHAIGVSETHNTVVGAVGEARWTYAVSKLAEEHLAIAHYKETGLPTVVVRPFNIYGPGQVGEGALKIFIQRAIQNLPLQIHGEGTQIRAWCFVDDMVNGVMLALHHENAIGESFNIGNVRSVETIYGLANTVIRVLKSKSAVEFTRRDYADVELRIPSVAKARKFLNFEARVDLEEGIHRSAEFYRKQMSQA